MTDPTDPTRHDLPADPLADAFRAEASEVPAVPGSKLVAAAATARAAERHRRVVVRRSTARRGSSPAPRGARRHRRGQERPTVGSGRRLGSGAGNAAMIGPGVMVDPSSGLVDGQTLKATANSASTPAPR